MGQGWETYEAKKQPRHCVNVTCIVRKVTLRCGTAHYNVANGLLLDRDRAVDSRKADVDFSFCRPEQRTAGSRLRRRAASGRDSVKHARATVGPLIQPGRGGGADDQWASEVDASEFRGELLSRKLASGTSRDKGILRSSLAWGHGEASVD